MEKVFQLSKEDIVDAVLDLIDGKEKNPKSIRSLFCINVIPHINESYLYELFLCIKRAIGMPASFMINDITNFVIKYDNHIIMNCCGPSGSYNPIFGDIAEEIVDELLEKKAIKEVRLGHYICYLSADKEVSSLPERLFVESEQQIKSLVKEIGQLQYIVDSVIAK